MNRPFLVVCSCLLLGFGFYAGSTVVEAVAAVFLLALALERREPDA